MSKKLIIGFYEIFRVTLYRDNKNPYFGALEHSLFVLAILHSININTLLQLLSKGLFGINVKFWIVLVMYIIVLLTVYIYFYRSKLAHGIVFKKRGNKAVTISVSFSVVYLLLTVYFMFSTNVPAGEPWEW